MLPSISQIIMEIYLLTWRICAIIFPGTPPPLPPHDERCDDKHIYLFGGLAAFGAPMRLKRKPTRTRYAHIDQSNLRSVCASAFGVTNKSQLIET